MPRNSSASSPAFLKFVTGFNPLTLPSPPEGERVKGEGETRDEFRKRGTRLTPESSRSQLSVTCYDFTKSELEFEIGSGASPPRNDALLVR